MNGFAHAAPSKPYRRPSVHRVDSDLSELAFHPEELDRQRPLLPLTTAHTHPRSRPRYKARFRAALAKFYARNYGVLLVLVAMFFGSGMNISTRLLETPGPHGEAMHPYQILFVRQSITSACAMTYGYWMGTIPHFPWGPRSVRLLLAARGLLGFVGVFGFYFSLRYLPISEATVLSFLSPILTCYICSYLDPGESFTKQQQLASFVSLIGVVFIARPTSFLTGTGASQGVAQNATMPATGHDSVSSAADGFTATPEQHLMAVGTSMIGVAGATGAYVAIRRIGERAHAFISINYFSVWCTIVSLFALAVSPSVSFRLPGNALEWGLLTLIGFCGFIMQFLMTVGLAYGGAKAESKASAHEGKEATSPATADSTALTNEVILSVTSPEPPTEQTVDTERSTSTQPRLYLEPTPSSSSSSHPKSVLRYRSPSPSKPDHHASHPSSPPPPALPPKPSQTNPSSSSSSPPIPPKVTGTNQQTRATSMVYTSMIFALAADKIIFGVAPTVWSWVGSGFILTGALWVVNATDTGDGSGSRSRERERRKREREKKDRGRRGGGEGGGNGKGGGGWEVEEEREGLLGDDDGGELGREDEGEEEDGGVEMDDLDYGRSRRREQDFMLARQLSHTSV